VAGCKACALRGRAVIGQLNAGKHKQQPLRLILQSCSGQQVVKVSNLHGVFLVLMWSFSQCRGAGTG
jgi:hypothetical protein